MITAAIKLEQVEKEISRSQQSLTELIDLYEYKVRRLETFVKIISNTSSNYLDRKVNLGNNELDLE
ncbi:MAG: lantibiotic (srt) production protein [Methanobrevibacter sp.]|nr:lantibiotic (srt) production protein [Methanobrevibacter sp.]